MESGSAVAGREDPEDAVAPGALGLVPAAELYGVQRIEYLDDVLVLSGAGVGGGTHVCASTLYVPPKQFSDAKEWSVIADWADELAPYYDQARRMLGVVRYPYISRSSFDATGDQLPPEIARWTEAIELDPSLTAAATRSIGARRTSPIANICWEPRLERGSGWQLNAADTGVRSSFSRSAWVSTNPS
jgi:choline dehydrogenase-like flavoprotein